MAGNCGSSDDESNSGMFIDDKSENSDYEYAIPVRNRFVKDNGCDDEWRPVMNPNNKRQRVSTGSVDNDNFTKLSSDA